MSTDQLSEIGSHVENLRRAGKGDEADKLLASILVGLSNIRTNPTFRVDLDGSAFKRDFREEGYDLVSNVEPMAGVVEFEAVHVLKDGESPVSGDELLRRALQLGSNLGQRDGENEKLTASIPAELRPYYIPLTGTVWVFRESRKRYLTYLFWAGRRWVIDLLYLGDDCGSNARLLVPCKKP